MAEDRQSETVRRTGGRSARVRSALFDAVLAELSDKGYAALTVSAVAGRAGVHRASIYRRWSDLDSLILAAAETLIPAPIDPPDTGELQDDLCIVGERIAAVFNGPAGGAVRSLLCTPTLRDAYSQARVGAGSSSSVGMVADIVDRAVRSGELPAGTEGDGVHDALMAPLVLALCRSEAGVDRSLVRQSAAATVAAARAGVFASRVAV